jgi:hypothetical protein
VNSLRIRSILSAIAAAFLLAAFLAVTHLYAIHDAPGLHFDEAWAANFAVRILREPGFWPFEAMSPYTAAWNHYWGALWMKWFGVSLESFRSSQIVLVIAGCAMGAWALKLRGASRAAFLFPILVAFSPPLVLNHRFTIDVNAFHPFCLGLVALGAAARGARPREGALLLAGGILLGVTSHLLFVGPALGLFLFSRWKRGREDRWLVTGVAALLLPFFLKVLFQIPEKDKALALICVDLAVIAAAWAPFRLPAPAALPRVIRWLGGALFAALGAAFLFFWEGHWGTLYTFGRVEEPGLIGTQLALVAILFASALPGHARSPEGAVLRDCAGWFAGTLFTLSFLMTKPSSRYFETAFLLFTALVAIALARLELRWPGRMRLWLVCFVAVGGFDLHVNYWRPAILGLQEEREFRFAFFRDSSRDSLPKQRVASFLADNGCRYDRVRTADPRVDEALRFLSHGDWEPVSGNPELRLCQWPEIRVERELSDQARLSSLDWIIARISGLLVLR